MFFHCCTRIQANAWQSKGGWTAYGYPAHAEDYKFKYVAPGLGFMFNLSNLFCGWNPNRVLNLTAFLGGGANIAWGNDEVNDIADYMQKYPNSKVVVTGYADAGTGNDKINDRLAAGRADAVVKSLINDYGIAQDRITYDSKGSRVQPFAENDMNRVTICIAE